MRIELGLCVGAGREYEIEGRDPVILDAPHGTWTEHPDEDDLWATYDLGVVKVQGGR